jgi:hypothetical protein
MGIETLPGWPERRPVCIRPRGGGGALDATRGVERAAVLLEHSPVPASAGAQG